MTTAFIIKLQLPAIDPSTLAGLAEQIHESCESDGLPVVSVTPWTHPSLENPSSFLSPETGSPLIVPPAAQTF